LKKILFIDNTHQILVEKLSSAGFLCDLKPGISRADLLKIIHEYEGIIIRSRIELDAEILNLAKNLKFIGRVGAGMESIDVRLAEKIGIKVYNSPEGNRDAVGEHATGMLLSLFNNLNRTDREIKSGEWNREKNRGIELKGKTVAIIGYGNMGSAFARKISGFEATVIAYDKYKEGFSDSFVSEVQMEEVFEKADILSLHVPLTAETNYLVNLSYLEKFKKHLYIINTSRGPVVKTSDLVNAIKSGKVRGACLDVIEYEERSFENLSLKDMPDDFKYLCSCENVIMSPHIAGWTVESKIRLAGVLGEKIVGGYGL